MTASLAIRRAEPGDRAAWSEFVGRQSGAEAGHCWGYHAMLHELFGHRVIRLVATRDGTWLGVLPLVLQSSMLGRFLTSVPYLNYAGVLGDDGPARRALAEAAAELARELRVDRLEIRGRDGSDLPVPPWSGKRTYGIGLPSRPQPLWDGLGAKLRAQIKRPSRERFAARLAGHEARPTFFAVLARRWHELGSPIVPEAFFAGLERVFGDRYRFVVVEREGEVAASGALLHTDGGVEIPWAASVAKYNRFGVNMLLYWTAIEHACRVGAPRFDFGRSTAGSGNARFKLQWGAVERPLIWNVHVAQARGSATETGGRRRELAAAMWRRLPRSIVEALGPRLAARIPY